MSNRNRTAGHNYERKVVDWWKKLGYNAKTSRYASREQDDLKIDLVGTEPFQVQCKYTLNQPNAHNLLDEMPKGHNIIFHKRNKGKGQKNSEIVIMRPETLEILINHYK